MKRLRGLTKLSPARRADLVAALDGVIARTDRAARREKDPVSVVRRYPDPLDQELAALLAASLAFGNVTTVLAKLDEVLRRLGPDLRAATEDRGALARTLGGWVHRVYRGEDVAALLAGARAVQRASGSLGARLRDDLSREGALRPALASFTDAIREAGDFASLEGRGGAHILADPSAASGCKRLLLFLRWMVRPDDGVDLGLWAPLLPTSLLVIPVDTHIHKLARNLGLTRRKQVTWQTAEEITGRLRELDPADPVRFDFALCHMGMSQRCPSRRDEARCDGCGVKPVCSHWSRRSTTIPPGGVETR